MFTLEVLDRWLQEFEAMTAEYKVAKKAAKRPRKPQSWPRQLKTVLLAAAAGGGEWIVVHE